MLHWGISLLALAGCMHESDDAEKTALEGVWKIGCNYDADDDIYETEELRFSGNGFSGNFVEFADASCSMKEYQFDISGSTLIGSEVILTSGETVNKIDITFAKALVTLGTDDMVIGFNTESVCSNSNWQKNVAVDITNCAFFEMPEKIYDIFKIDGNNLKFGDESTGDGDSDSTRPTQLDDTAYSKQ